MYVTLLLYIRPILRSRQQPQHWEHSEVEYLAHGWLLCFSLFQKTEQTNKYVVYKLNHCISKYLYNKEIFVDVAW